MCALLYQSICACLSVSISVFGRKLTLYLYYLCHGVEVNCVAPSAGGESDVGVSCAISFVDGGIVGRRVSAPATTAIVEPLPGVIWTLMPEGGQDEG